MPTIKAALLTILVLSIFIGTCWSTPVSGQAVTAADNTFNDAPDEPPTGQNGGEDNSTYTPPTDQPGQAGRPIRLSALPLLFADDAGIESRESLTRTLHPASTRAEPVIKADKPFNRVYIYGTAAPDPENGPDAARMWFMHVGKPGTGVGTRVLHASSPDGVNWPKVSDCKEVFRISSPSVLIDPFEKDPARRYKLMGGKKYYKTAYSSDGINWTENPGTVGAGGDTLTIAQNPHTGEYLCYRKSERVVRGKNRRVVSLMKSSDFATWKPAGSVLWPDETDDSYATGPEQSMQIYGMSVYPHAAGYIGLAMMFQITSVNPKAGPGTSGQDGPIDVQIVTSSDGHRWERSTPRLPMIPRGKHGKFDAGAILGVSNLPIHTKDHTNVYYTGITTGHGGAMPEKQISIGLAQWRLHGFASLDANTTTGTLQTKPLLLSGGRLAVNADAARGEIKIGLLEADGKPIPGYTITDCQPLKKDHKNWDATWNGKQTAPNDRPVKVVVQLTNASIYSLSSPDIAR